MPPKSARNSAGSKGKHKGKKTKSSPEDGKEEKPEGVVRQRRQIASKEDNTVDSGTFSSHPEDIFPMVLTSATQELFGCLADEDVTGESPYKLLKKDDIIQDFKTRAAVSDFSPVKQIVLDYPEEEILLVFDRDFTYGQSFYLVLTPEAKNRILKPQEPEEPEVLETEVIKPLEPKPWIPLGSEQEIEKESVKETRDKLCFKFSRVRRKFGAKVCFSDRSAADGFLEFPSYEDSRFSIKQMQRDSGMQAVPRLQSSSAQTQWKVKKNVSTQYEPRELSDSEKESILHSKSLMDFLNLVTPRVFHSLQQAEIMNVFIDDWKALGAATEEVDGQFSEGLMLFEGFTNPELTKGKKISCINWHPTCYGVIAVALTAKKEEQISVSNFDAKRSIIFFYSFTHPFDPQLLLECPDDIYAFEFCPSDPNIIVGGCVNGKVVLWDISAYVTHLQGAQPAGKNSSVNTDTFDLDHNKEKKTPVVCYCAVSSIDYSHKAPITDVHWLPPTFEVSRTGVAVENKNNICVQVVTCSPDCTMLFWDVRVSKTSSHSVSSRRQKADQKSHISPYHVPDTFKHLDRTWKPMFKVSLPKLDESGEYAPLKFSLDRYTCANADKTAEDADENGDSSEVILDYSQLGVPPAQSLATLQDVNTKLYIGTEDGEIVYTDWKLQIDDRGWFHSAKPLQCSNVHHWFVHTVQRSPFFKDIILTIGPWNFAIWREGVLGGPIIASPCFEKVYTVGCWSLSRPAVFFIGKEDGSIEAWDLLEKSGEPVQDYTHLTKDRISCMKPCITSTKQHLLAVTDDHGEICVFKIPKKLCVPSKSEHLSLRESFERDEARLKDFLMRKEHWDKERKEAEVQQKTQAEIPEKTSEEMEEKYLRDYKEYLALEEKVLKDLGLWHVKAEKQ